MTNLKENLKEDLKEDLKEIVPKNGDNIHILDMMGVIETNKGNKYRFHVIKMDDEMEPIEEGYIEMDEESFKFLMTKAKDLFEGQKKRNEEKRKEYKGRDIDMSYA